MTHPTLAARIVAGLLTFLPLGCSEMPSKPMYRQLEASRAGATQWGVVIGSIADSAAGGPVNLTDSAATIACDLNQLGLTWVRVDAGDGTGDLSAYQKFVTVAHAHGVNVLVLVHPDNRTCAASDASCGAASAWAGGYVAKVNHLIDAVFTGASAADAYEIGNEPNDGQSHISPTSFAFLLDAVWQGVKKAPHASAFLVVSGGVYNTYVDEVAWWTPFFNALPSEQPWDVFAIHPYDSASYGPNRDLSSWAARVASSVGDIQARLSGLYGHPSRIWATEVGFSSASSGEDSAGDDDAQATAFAAADDALRGVTEVAFWYDYRDDEAGPGSENKVFGIRRTSANQYSAKPLYGAIALAFKAPGDPEACGAPDAGTEAGVANGCVTPNGRIVQDGFYCGGEIGEPYPTFTYVCYDMGILYAVRDCSTCPGTPCVNP